MQKPTGEVSHPNEANNGLSQAVHHRHGAHHGPHSATAQFFINVADNAPELQLAENLQGWGYCVFGEAVEGQDVVDKIKTVKWPRHGPHQDVPVEEAQIIKAEIIENAARLSAAHKPPGVVVRPAVRQ